MVLQIQNYRNRERISGVRGWGLGGDVDGAHKSNMSAHSKNCAILGSVATNSSFSWLSDTFSTECPGCLWDPSTLDSGNSIFLHCVTSKILFSSQSPNSYFLPNVTKSWPVLHCFLFPQTLRRALLWTSGATFSVHVPSDQAPGPELPSTSAAPHSALFRLYPLNPLL